MGLQGIPLSSLTQQLDTGPSAHHACNHPEGFCPMSPGGDCTCSHADVPDEPTFRPCSGPSSDAVVITMVSKWHLDRNEWALRPSVRPVSQTPHVSILSSQQVPDDIFHPPRT